jgi:alkanesulfonate monooxygenase SsuD/methylene tetrahydromethanopterin reductase-like flavin-dependent oxidoreductase (luciferase family)
VLAKEAATIDALSGGRLTLGLAVGARTEDFDAAGVPHAGRGARFEEQLAELRDLWEGGPGPKASPELLVGGASDAAFARMARYGDGYVHSGGPPRAFARAADRARAAWTDLGRPGDPALWGQSYFALGDDAKEPGLAYMRDYYAFTGPFAERIAEALLTTPQAVAAKEPFVAKEPAKDQVAASEPRKIETAPPSTNPALVPVRPKRQAPVVATVCYVQRDGSCVPSY